MINDLSQFLLKTAKFTWSSWGEMAKWHEATSSKNGQKILSRADSFFWIFFFIFSQTMKVKVRIKFSEKLTTPKRILLINPHLINKKKMGHDWWMVLTNDPWVVPQEVITVTNSVSQDIVTLLISCIFHLVYINLSHYKSDKENLCGKTWWDNEIPMTISAHLEGCLNEWAPFPSSQCNLYLSPVKYLELLNHMEQ